MSDQGLHARSQPRHSSFALQARRIEAVKQDCRFRHGQPIVCFCPVENSWSAFWNNVCHGQDGTLIGTKGTATFPVSEDDWRYFSKKVPKELQALHEKGFKIVIFRFRNRLSAQLQLLAKHISDNVLHVCSNQNGIKSALEGKMAQKIKGRVVNMLKEVKISAVPKAPGLRKNCYALCAG